MSRRDFCAAAGAGLVTLGLTACGGSGASANDLAGPVGPDLLAPSTCPPGTVAGGDVAAITVGTAKRLSGGGQTVFLCRDDAGLYAMDAACTHEGQILSKQSTRFFCPRHGATFDLNGENPTSPAFSPLDHYAVCVDSAGQVTIDTDTVVDASTRV